MKTTKIGVLFVVFVMAFTAVAASYAHWEETLTISGVMTTDDINPGFYCEDSNDDPTDGLPQCDPTACGYWDETRIWRGDRRDKDVGSATISSSPDKNSLSIIINDAYPCYYAHLFWCVNNYGSCPVVIHSVKLTKLSFIWTNPETGNHIDVEWDVDQNLVVGKYYFVKVYYEAGVGWQVQVDKYNNGNARPEYDFYITPTGTWTIDTQIDPDA